MSTTGTPEKGKFRFVEGVRIPTRFEEFCGRPMEEQMTLLKVMDMRHDDVIIAAFPKAGTHWIWEVTSMLMSGKAHPGKRTKGSGMLEATPMEELQSLPSPRILNSHLPPRVLPRQVKEKKVRVVHVYRNVKDVLVSAYFHFRQVLPETTLESLESEVIGPGAPGGDYFSYMQEMDDFRKDNPDFPLFTMSFEDTKEDPQKAIGKLAEFLRVELSSQVITDIAEATSITRMREADKQKQQKDSVPSVQIYRKGQVGDWKNYLTVAQSERLDAAMTQLQSRDYHFRYTL